jgi:2-keto-3-deoxy-L-rhamnonate aldolase RhmA
MKDIGVTVMLVGNDQALMRNSAAAQLANFNKLMKGA